MKRDVAHASGASALPLWQDFVVNHFCWRGQAMRRERNVIMAATTRAYGPPHALLAGAASAPAGLAQRLSDACLQLSTLLFLAVSPLMLANFGLHYAGAGGSFLEKIHPCTWVAMMALGFKALSRPRPLTILQDFFDSYAVGLYMIAWLALLMSTIFIQKQPFTPAIDTFLLPPMLFVLASDLGERQRLTICRIFHVMMTANALLGLIEFKTGFRLTPSELVSEAGPTVAWRASAFLGHPLGNAMFTGSYALALAVSKRSGLPDILKMPIILLQLGGLFSFGGRAALVVTIALLGLVACLRLLEILLGARFSRAAAGAVLIVFPILLGGLVLVAQAGFFDQMLSRFSDDNGSAAARVAMLELFRYIGFADLMLGPDPTYLTALQYQLNIEVGIESFWIAFLLQNGGLISLIFFPALGCLTWAVISRTTPGALIVLIFYYFVASTSLSMSAKTPMFGMTLFMMLVMLKRMPAPYWRGRED